MAEKIMENNKVTVIGEIISGFTFSHEVFGEGFYLTEISINRLSDQKDIIPLLISERLLDITGDYTGMIVEASGQFRSYNRHEGTRNRLVLSVFVREIAFLESFSDCTKTNQIFLDGYICKTPIYRKTPPGAGDRRSSGGGEPPYGKSDYIPCIAWGTERQVRLRLRGGEPHLRLGRVQSREYVKRLSETESEKRVAYEVSVSKLEWME